MSLFIFVCMVSYKQRVLYALRNPERCMSLIWDGMDQNHSRCPHLGTQDEFAHPLRQHIQGVLVHGVGNYNLCIFTINILISNNTISTVGLTLYRTFNNISKGADLSTHCFLAELKKWRDTHDDKFPEEVLVQMDGGSENANKTIIAICEYLVSKRMVRSITLSRLPTGHTHEDIDACFAHIWRGMRSEQVHTVEEYVSKVEAIFSGSLKATVKDLYIIPDYTSFFENHIDKHFKNYTKEEDTQHQFKFDAIDVSVDFPMGCRVMYRAYCSDKVIEFVQKPALQCLSRIGMLTGLEPHTLLVTWGPKRRSLISETNEVTGFYLLKSIPYLAHRALFPPSAFVENSMESFGKTIAEAKKRFVNNPAVLQSWNDWEASKLGNIQQDAVQYALERPILYQVPFLYFFRDPGQCSPEWVQKLSQTIKVEDEGFVWPEQLAAAMHSVRSTWQRDPMPSRTFAAADDDLRAILNEYETKANQYYTVYMDAKFTVDRLKQMLKQRLSGTGQKLALGGVKASLITRVQQSDRAYLAVLYKTLKPENIYLLTTVLYRPYRSAEESTLVKATSTDKSLTLTLQQIRQFSANHVLRFEVMRFLIHLFNERMKRMIEVHFSLHGTEDKYQALKNNLFMCFPSANLAGIPPLEVQDLYKVYLCFKLSDDVDRDDWVGLVVDFERKCVYYIDPKLSGDVALTPELQVELLGYELTIYEWLQRSQYPVEPRFPCRIYPKEEHCFEVIQNEVDAGIYVIVMIDMIFHDCPRYFSQFDTYTFRQNLCYSVLNNYLPY